MCYCWALVETECLKRRQAISMLQDLPPGAEHCLASRPAVAAGVVIHPTNLPLESFHLEKEAHQNPEGTVPRPFTRQMDSSGTRTFVDVIVCYPNHSLLFRPEELFPQLLRVEVMDSSQLTGPPALSSPLPMPCSFPRVTCIQRLANAGV